MNTGCSGPRKAVFQDVVFLVVPALKIGFKAGYKEWATPTRIRSQDNTSVARFFHPLLTLIASATDRELAKYVQFLKEENKILRKRAGVEIHTQPEERQRLIQFRKALGRAIEELITIVSPDTFYRWVRAEQSGKKVKAPKAANGSPARFAS